MVMLGKELQEIFRTWKIFVIPGIFLLFGLASPILTKLLPDLMANLVEDMVIQLPEMTWQDSYLQFFKNLNQIGLLAIILTTMGTVAEEKSRGIAQVILTKPVPRWGFIMAKFAASLLLVAAATLLALAAAWLYTDILFEGTRFIPALAATGLYLVYTMVILSLTLLASAATRSTVAAGGLAVLGFFTLSLLPLLHPVLNKYSPAALLEYQAPVLAGTAGTAQVWVAVLVGLLTAIILLAAAIGVFTRQEL